MKLITLPLACATLLITGCATGDYAQYSKAQTDIAVARHAADAAKYRAMSDIAASGDSAAKVAAVMAMAMGGSGAQTTIQAPQVSEALQWASILVPGLTQISGMRYNYLSQQALSNNATALGISNNSTFAGLAGKIQAPGSVTTNTLSGTGTLGSGAYSTQDRHDVISAAPVVITPIVQVVPTVITPVTQIVPTVITPIIPTTPIVITPITPTVPIVITPIFQPVAPKTGGN